MLISLRKLSVISFVFIFTLLVVGCDKDNKKKDVNEKILGYKTPQVLDKTSYVGQYVKEVNGKNTYSLRGVDSKLFNIDQEGNVEFNTAPVIENGDVGPYYISIVITNETGVESLYAVIITVIQGRNTSAAVIQTVSDDSFTSKVLYVNAMNRNVTNPFYINRERATSLDVFGSNIYSVSDFDVSKYSVESPDQESWLYSTKNILHSVNVSPNTLVSLSDKKAYLIRSRSSKIWIVNPESSSEEDFKIGELDLSSYIPSSSITNSPRPFHGIIKDGKLFVVMQRRDSTFGDSNTGYIAVFDTNTDEEIETNSNNSDGLKGVPINGINPLGDSLSDYENMIYITTGSTFKGMSDKSLIEELNVTDYTIKTVLSAKNVTGDEREYFQGSVIVSGNKGYFYTVKSNFDPFSQVYKLYQFNPKSGKVKEEAVLEYTDEKIKFIRNDKQGFLWVGVDNKVNPGVDILDVESNAQVGKRVMTLLSPTDIGFLKN